MSAQKRSRWGHIQTLIPDEKYRIYWPVARDKTTGKRKSASETIYGTYDDADIALAKKRIDSCGIDKEITYDEYWASVIDPSIQGLASKTKSWYRRIYRHELSPRIGKIKVALTTWRLVCKIIADIESPSTQRAAHRLWKKICNMARHDALLSDCPVDRTVPMSPLIKREKTELEAPKIIPFISSAKNTRYVVPVILEMIGGLRHEEACAVLARDIAEIEYQGKTYAAVNIERALVYVDGRKELKETKTSGLIREILIAEPFASILFDYAETSEKALLEGPRPEGDEVNESWYANPQHVSRNWRKWCERNNQPYIRFGDMRTIYSNRHAEAGSPDSLVSLSMGHNDGTTRGRNYQFRTQKSMIMLADILAEYLISEAPCSNLLRVEEASPQVKRRF